MSEEVKGIRLSKAAKEFNIAVNTVIEFLESKGFEVDSNPNSKLTPDMYGALEKQFQGDKKTKEAAEKIALEYQKKETVTIKETPKVAEKEEEEEYNIKSATLEKKAKPAVKTKEKDVKEEPIAETPEKSEKIEPEKEELQKKTATKKKTEEEIIEEKVEEENVVEGPKVLGKIDLSIINSKTRPDKKSKKELAEAREAKIAEEKKKKKDPKKPSEKVEKTKQKPKEKPIVEPSVQEKTPEPIIPQAEERVIEHIKTEYKKVEGPKMTGQTIDLSQFNKKPSTSPSPTGNSKKKRERIRKDKKKSVDIKEAIKNAEKAGWKKEAKPAKQGKARPITEVDNTEIEKQIKETLARLGGTGKSKFSKHRREKRSQIAAERQEEAVRAQQEAGVLKVTEFVTANELAHMMNVPVTSIIGTCMSVGQFVSINQRLNAEIISLLADEYGFKIEFVGAEVMETLSEVEEADNPEDLRPRAPIVTVMGHVDHGKTSLLDYIRHANVIAGEAGGITQHIGAYEVTLDGGRQITFLDTPGHEAFTAMRARGAKITDIAIIVIAADDRIMPQTIEAINHAQAGNVPIVFAINKIDKPTADPTRIKQALAEMNILVEEWGGKYQSQDIAAKIGTGIPELLEKVLLEADILELKANPKKRAKGTIIEASLDKGRGFVANVLIQDGTISVGDDILAGSTYGRVKAMFNERNRPIQKAGPSQPILLLGLNGAPQAGDGFNVTPSDKEAKDVATRRLQLQREQGLRTHKHITLDEIGRRIAIGDFKELNVIVKGDVDGSVEALADSLLKLSTPEVQVKVIHKAVGQISEGDVVLASASDALIIGFQVRPSVSARRLAESEQIDIRLYSVIYKAIEEVKDSLEGMLAPDVQEKITCNLEVKEVFKITKVGSIAGCIVLDGKIQRSTKVRIIRDGIVVYTGKLGSLKRFKDDVKEVVSGQDCGLNIENFNDIKVGDIIEGYEIIETKRTL
ncbi:MAG: translation initiation factor IF-2 [Bacteroidales bacterium]|jgi:translation initiation factor IF-2|nr:translation initiation factor IF-2 [Bacteroidales bacterium]